jgi:sec-independent protein translocase protein TatC
MPMITYALTKVGIISPTFMKNHRRHAIVIFLIIAAIITPSPDMISQLLVTAPLIGLYEISIKISAKVVGKNYDQ